jgi:uncharacterized membrane protein YciS (DUF1049 family)
MVVVIEFVIGAIIGWVISGVLMRWLENRPRQ